MDTTLFIRATRVNFNYAPAGNGEITIQMADTSNACIFRLDRILTMTEYNEPEPHVRVELDTHGEGPITLVLKGTLADFEEHFRVLMRNVTP